MKRFKWLLIGLVVVCLTMIPLAGCIGVSQSEYEALQTEYEALQAEQASLVAENTSVKGQLEEVQSDLTSVQADYDALKAEYEVLKAQYETANITPGHTPTPMPTPSTTPKLRRGQYLIAQDGTYLGILDSGFASESIFNDFSNYGSQFSLTSIWNDFGKYGSEFSPLSAFNDLASKPPMLFDGDTSICYVTTNTLKTPRVSPYSLIAFAESMGWE